MATERFVLRYRGEGAMPDADVARVRSLPGATVVGSTPRMLVVDADPEPMGGLADSLRQWVVGREQTYAVPDTRKTVERPPP